MVGAQIQEPLPVRVNSRDGTTITYWKSGAGPPLLLVHGITTDHTRWRPVLPALEKEFTVCLMDRRGRGESRDGAEYDLMRESEDVAAVVNSLGQPVHLLGHSFGALCTLEAALLTPNVRKLVLYEPTITDGQEDPFPPWILGRLDELLRNGDREGVLQTVLQEVGKVPADDLQLQRSFPAWKNRVAVAHTIPRELRAEEGYDLDIDHAKKVQNETMLLVGDHAPMRYRETIDRLRKGLPNARATMKSGIRHATLDTPGHFATEDVVKFLTT